MTDLTPGAIGGDAALLSAIEQAEKGNQHARPCQVCVALASMSSQAESAVKRALAGTIGEQTLATILTGNGYPTGRRAISRHRSEGHS